MTVTAVAVTKGATQAMNILSIQRLPVARQRAVGSQMLPILQAETNPKRKRLDALVARVGAFAAAHRALVEAAVTPKLAVDNGADRAFGGVFTLLRSVVQTYDQPIVPLDDEAQARSQAARTLLALAFPQGVAFTRKPMSLQYEAMRQVVRALRSEAAEDSVAVLGLGSTVDFLEAILAPYGVAVTGPDSRDLERLSDTWHDTFAKLAATIVGVLPDNDRLHDVIALYEKETAAQSASMTEARRRAKKTTP